MVDLERNGLEMKLTGYEVAKAKSSNESARFSPSVFGVSSTRVTPCLCTWFVISVSMLTPFAVCFSCFLFRRVYISFIRFSPLTSVHGWFPSSCEHDNIPARNKFNQIFCSCFLISKYESWIVDSLVVIIVLANTLHLRVGLLQIHLYQHSLQPVQICVGFISLGSVCSVLKLSLNFALDSLANRSKRG